MQDLPVSTQFFKKLRKNNAVYVDKTEYIYEVLHKGGSYFMSRPRRFGKSLFLSTMMELAKSERALFEGTYVADKWDWSQKYPVIYLDFSPMSYEDLGLENAIIKHLLPIYEENEIEPVATDVKGLFLNLILALYKKEGKVVVLIDEYDKPILDTIEKDMPEERVQRERIMKKFYSVLKACDQYLHCTFITGIAKFAKVSLFSDLNHLMDLTMHPKFATAYGYTQTELEASFADYLHAFLAKNEEYTMESLLEKIKEWYNGYSWDGKTRLYNPYGIIHFFEQGYFFNSWYASGTPTFLIKKMLHANILEFENVEVNTNYLDFKSIDRIDLTVLMFQSGYLTITEMDKDRNALLNYPNREVRESIYHYLLDEINDTKSKGITPIQFLAKAFRANDLIRIEELVSQVFYELSYDVYSKQTVQQVEVFYHGIINILFKYVGLYVQSEVHTTRGRADSVVETETHVYILEFKINESAKIALQQIHDRDYARKYLATSAFATQKNVVLIGANFNTNSRYLDDWEVEEIFKF